MVASAARTEFEDVVSPVLSPHSRTFAGRSMILFSDKGWYLAASTEKLSR